MSRTYNELIKYNTLLERYKYLQLHGAVAASTFGSFRWLNQVFYKSKEWLEFKAQIVIRDKGCELGIPGYEINGPIYLHHIMPITKDDILNRNLDKLLNPNNVICCSYNMHQAIHYGNEDMIPQDIVVRKPNDTCPWKK